jgi:hypothetical protein
MGTINAANPSIDQTVRIFDQFYNYAEDIPAAEYDIVWSYFNSVFNTTEQAQNFTVAWFRAAQAAGVSAVTMLQQVEGQTGPQLTLSLAYYLNSVQSPATMLGILTPVSPNYWAARNVRQ